ncbi:hypothetical protein CW705_05660 [Candidatus Bathyarchaeota archaeon]|nr:MAG: hypothetical protein CW705_05660 [Candidatus Bathyarchaeota archaeon]
MIELFYSPICPYCPKAKRILLEALDEMEGEVHLDEINVFSLDGLKRAKNTALWLFPR